MAHKKFFIVIIICLAIFVLIFIHEINWARSITVKPVTTPIIASQAVPIYTTSTDPLLGNPGAPITVVGFFDLGDSASKKLEQTIANFVSTHPLDIRFYWKALPNKHFFFDNGEDIHEAAYCAAAQNDFWPFAAALENQSSSNDAALLSSATIAGINVAAWQTCRSTHATAALVAESKALAASLGLTQAPALFINNFAVTLTPGLDVGELLNSLIQPPVSTQ